MRRLVLAVAALSLAPFGAALADGFGHGACSRCKPLETRAVGVEPFYIVDQGPSYVGRPPLWVERKMVFTYTDDASQRPTRTIAQPIQPIGWVAPDTDPVFTPRARVKRHAPRPVSVLY
jgi:hypothetical protein